MIITNATLIQTELDYAGTASRGYVNVTDAENGDGLPTGGYDWSEWAIALVRLDGDTVAFRCESSQLDEDWQIGTPDDAAEALDAFISHCWDVVKTDEMQYA